jgi:hypothetical protein
MHWTSKSTQQWISCSARKQSRGCVFSTASSTLPPGWLTSDRRSHDSHHARNSIEQPCSSRAWIENTTTLTRRSISKGGQRGVVVTTYKRCVRCIVGQLNVFGSILLDRLHGGHESRKLLRCIVISFSTQVKRRHIQHSLHRLTKVPEHTCTVNTQYRSSCADRPPASADPDHPWFRSVGLPFRKRFQPISALASVNTDRGIYSSSYQIAPKSLRNTRRDLRELRCVQCVICAAVSCVDETRNLRSP